MFKEKFEFHKKRIKKCKQKKSVIDDLSFIYNLFIFSLRLFSIVFIMILISNILNNNESNLDLILTSLFSILSLIIMSLNSKKIENKINKKYKDIENELENLDDFSMEEIFENIENFSEIKNYKEIVKKHIQKNENLLIENLKYICTKTNYYDWIFIIEIKDKKKLLLSKEMEWYKNQVSQTKLYNYFKEEIEDIIKNEEKEHYLLIKILFSDFMDSHLLEKVNSNINIEKKIAIIKM